MTPLSPNDPTISSEELYERLEELEDQATANADSDLLEDDSEDSFAEPNLSELEARELASLQSLDDQLRFHRGDSSGFTLVHAGYLESFAREYAQGFRLDLSVWPLTAISWIVATQQLALTHLHVDFSGETYYVF